MEGLQLAQMLADLSGLNAAEPNAAAALVTANKTIEKVEHQQSHLAVPGKRPTDDLRRAHSAQALERSSSGHHGSPSSLSPSPATGGTSSGPARLDKYGRKIFMSPPLTRTNSSQGSAPGTPRRESETEDDIDRASTLMALYDIRAKLKQQDNSSLMKAREKIADLAAKQQSQGHGAGAGGHHTPVGHAQHMGAPRRDAAKFAYPRV